MSTLAPPVFGAEICGRWGAVRERDGGSVTHWAIDLCAPVGEPIYNLLPGIVWDVVWSEHGGNQIVMYWGRGMFARHSHCDVIWKKKGQWASRYEMLGRVGKTGVNANGRAIDPHLHLQVMTKETGGDPVDMPALLGSLGIVEEGRRLVWRDDAPRPSAVPMLLGAAAFTGSLVGALTKSKVLGLAAAAPLIPP